jgi:O-antigen/teichoic acid export membrane protein
VRLLASFAVPVAVGGTAFAKPIVTLVFGQSYALGAEPLAILLWSVLVAFVSSTLNYALVASGRGLLVTAAAVGAAGVNVALNLVLIPPFGMNGAAVSTVAAEGVVLFVLVARGHQLSSAILRDLARIVPPAGVMAMALIWTSSVAVPIGLATGIGAFVSVAFITGVWTSEDRAELRRAVAYLAPNRWP